MPIKIKKVLVVERRGQLSGKIREWGYLDNGVEMATSSSLWQASDLLREDFATEFDLVIVDATMVKSDDDVTIFEEDIVRMAEDKLICISPPGDKRLLISHLGCPADRILMPDEFNQREEFSRRLGLGGEDFSTDGRE